MTIAFIFDLDGCILDDAQIMRDLPVSIAKKFHVYVDPLQGLLTTKRLIENLNEARGKRGKFDLLWYAANEFHIPWYLRRKYFQELGRQYKSVIVDCPLIDGTLETLKFLQANGHPIGLFTSSSDQEVEDRFRLRSEVLQYFTGNIITRDKITRLKPYPDGILQLSQKWQIPPIQCIMIGDMVVDIKAGQRCGAFTIGVLTGFDTAEDFKTAQADLIINSIKDIPSIYPTILTHLSSRA